MVRVEAAIIGGTGIGSRLAELEGAAVCVPTRLGAMRCRVVQLEGRDVAVVARHSAGHTVPPHRVEYAATALGLKFLGVRRCFATAAVGSLRADWGAGTLLVPHDFLDLSGRGTTLFDREVAHTDFSTPLPARGALVTGAGSAGVEVRDSGVYVNCNGPRYESPHETAMLAKVGDVVGMTAGSEAIVMREAGVDYGLLAIVTNFACGIGEGPLSHEEVVLEMERSGETALKVLRAALAASA